MSGMGSDFSRDIPRGIATRFLNQQSVPQARWQDPAQLARSPAVAYDCNRPGARVLVGALGECLIGIEDNRHVLTVAGSRAGKSVMLVANLMFYRGSVLALDPKGELANLTARRRAALGQDVHVLDPFLTCRDHVAPYRKRYNPLAMLRIDSDTVIEDAGMIADALVVPSAGKDPHWDESARNFIEGLILHIASDASFEGRRTLVTLRDLLRDAMIAAEGDDEVFALEDAMFANAERLSRSSDTDDLANAIESAAREFYEKPDRERASVLSTARRHTKFLDYKAMRRVLSGHDFDLADLKRAARGQTLYLCLPASRMGLCNRWLRLFVNQMLDAMERERAKPAAPVLVCLDEFPVLGHMRQLEDAAGQIASFDVKLWVFLQDWGQGKALYGERWETFAGNAGVLQFFGNNDLMTMEYVSRRLGKTMVAVTREGEVGPDQSAAGLSGRSESIELHDLLTPEEVSRLFARADRLKRQLVIWAGYHPMILQRVEYFDATSPLHALFAGKYDPA
ncbi:type IV secretory system conjugative DNA transfer family protein [Mycoplana ramosa]|uniref:Type IV secretory system conjugative DNA transfer family protein n=1 Tax=Mycoplana ramosa TaxID=40837 RepID=A0ABW3YY40_MYCRA